MACVAILPTETSGKMYIFPAVRLGPELVCAVILPNIECIQAESMLMLPAEM